MSLRDRLNTELKAAMRSHDSARLDALRMVLAAVQRAETLRAVRAFASSKPWRGTLEERQSKFRQLHTDLCRIYNVNPSPDSHGPWLS